MHEKQYKLNIDKRKNNYFHSFPEGRKYKDMKGIENIAGFKRCMAALSRKGF